MHDWVDAGTAVVVSFDLTEIGEEVGDRFLGAEGGGLGGREEGVDVAIGQHLGEILAWFDRGDGHARGKGVGNFAYPLG